MDAPLTPEQKERIRTLLSQIPGSGSLQAYSLTSEIKAIVEGKSEPRLESRPAKPAAPIPPPISH